MISKNFYPDRIFCFFRMKNISGNFPEREAMDIPHGVREDIYEKIITILMACKGVDVEEYVYNEYDDFIFEDVLFF